MLKGRQGGDINDFTRQAIPYVNDTFCEELRSGHAAATVAFSTYSLPSQFEISKIKRNKAERMEYRKEG